MQAARTIAHRDLVVLFHGVGLAVRLCARHHARSRVKVDDNERATRLQARLETTDHEGHVFKVVECLALRQTVSD